MYEDLTDRQLAILNYIKKVIKTKGYPPSVREIGEAVGLSSSSTVHGHLAQLEHKGYIRKDPTKPRAIEVVDNNMINKELINVPIVGKVTAGKPILAVENIEDFFPIPYDFARSETVFMLEISGNSMIEAGILDGDYVLVRQQTTARNGDIVIALIDDEATCKTFYKEQNYFRLQPQNSQMEAIIVTDVIILGKVTGVFRKLH